MFRQSGCRRPAQVLQTCSALAKHHQVRHLSLHEYQAYELLRQYGVPLPRGKLAQTSSDVQNYIKSLGGPAVIKAQVLQSGRGHGIFDNGLVGGIQRVPHATEGQKVASRMINHRLRSEGTAKRAPLVRQVYVDEEMTPREEWYVAITIDRERYCPALVISRRGGPTFDSMIRNTPESVFTFPLHYDSGFTEDVLDSVQQRLSISRTALDSLQDVLRSLWKIFTEKDATLLELNPLALLQSDVFTPLNAKFTFDDAAARRQPEIFSMRDAEQEVTEEVDAEKFGLVYIRMDGNIGNVVNGAGLAMATNDAIGLHGGTSANFLDAGGQATKETMIQAFRIILADERVKTILVNVYGGITKCDMIAKSIIGAASELGPMTIPIVARLQGTNSAEGLRLLEEANLGIHVEAGFGEAAKKAVELAGDF